MSLHGEFFMEGRALSRPRGWQAPQEAALAWSEGISRSRSHSRRAHYKTCRSHSHSRC